jgi:hypothetical protein
MNKTVEIMKKSGVKLVEEYLDGPKYVFYFIVEANDNVAINNDVETCRLIGTEQISPVMNYSQSVAWTKDIGIKE